MKWGPRKKRTPSGENLWTRFRRGFSVVKGRLVEFGREENPTKWIEMQPHGERAGGRK